MGAYIESIILYIIIFVRGSTAGQTAFFSIPGEIQMILLYYIPSLALIWYLHQARLFQAAGSEVSSLTSKNPKQEYSILIPGKKDLFCALIAFPCLLITGFAFSIAAEFTGGDGAQILYTSPSSTAGWIMACITCVFSAYLEESFFRFYLLTKREDLNLGAPLALIFSAALFSICHIYEGPWGFLNSLVSALLLGLLFLKFKSLHGLAIAHALYNITAYALNALNN